MTNLIEAFCSLGILEHLENLWAKPVFKGSFLLFVMFDQFSLGDIFAWHEAVMLPLTSNSSSSIGNEDAWLALLTTYELDKPKQPLWFSRTSFLLVVKWMEASA